MSDAHVAPPSSLDALGVDDPRPAREQPARLPSPPLIPPASQPSHAKPDREQQDDDDNTTNNDDDVLSTKADSEAETIIQSGRESLSPEKRRKHIQHLPRNDVPTPKEDDADDDAAASPSAKKRKRSHDDSAHDSPPAPKSSSSPSPSRQSSPPPVVKKEVSDVQPSLTRRDSATSTAADHSSVNGIVSGRKRSGSESVAEDDSSDREPPSRSRQNSDSSRDRQRREKTQPTPSSRLKDRSSSPSFRSHKRAASGPQQGLVETLHRKRKLPAPLSTSHHRHSSEDRQSQSSSASASPAPSSHSRRLTSTEGAAAHPGKVANHKKQRDQNGRTRLARACAAHEFEAAVARHAERPEDLNVPDNAGNTPLQIAALEGCVPIVKFLLEAGCEIDTKNIDKDTPLIDAVENGHLQVVKLLLDAGANPRTVNAEGDEPYDLVPSDIEEYEEMRRIISQAKANPSRKRPSEDNGNRSSSAKASVPRAISAASPRDSPPAHSMMSPPPGQATSTRRKTVRSEATRNDLLWTKPTQENLCNFAAKGDMAGVANVLNVIQKADSESLIAAAKGGHEDVMSLLLGMGDADPDPEPVQNSNCRPGYNTPMLAAIGRGNLAIIRLLLDQRGFNPTRRLYRGSTYYELATDRKGENWEEEAAILKKAYDESKNAKKLRKAEANKSPKRSRDQEKDTVRKSQRDSTSPVAAPRRPVRSPNSSRHVDAGAQENKAKESSHSRDKVNGIARPKTAAREDAHSEHSADQDLPKPKKSVSERQKSDASSLNRSEDAPKRRRLIAGRPPQDRDKRWPSLMSVDSLSGREEFSKAHGDAAKETADTSEKHSKAKLKRARNSVSPERSRSQGPENGKDSEEYHKKKRRLQPEEGSHKHVNGIKKTAPLESPPSKKEQRPSHSDTTNSHREALLDKRGARPADTTVPVKKEQKKQDSQSLDRIPMDDSREGDSLPDAKEGTQDSEARKPQQEDEEVKTAEEIENERLAKEEEENRKAAEQAKLAREKAEEEERKRKEAEQRRAKQAEEERQRRAEQERARLAKLRKEQEEQEQRRRDALPSRLRVAANLVGANDPRAKSHAWLKQFMPVVTAKTKQLDPSCASEVAEDLWVPNYLVAPLLATNDLQLSQYSSWEKRNATYTQRLNLWRVTRRILVQTDDLDASDCSFGRVIQRDGETRPKYFDMEHVFWVKLSDFMDLVPHIPHLHGLELDFLKMHIDQEPSLGANHSARPQVNGNVLLPTEPAASSMNGLTNGYGPTHHSTYV